MSAAARRARASAPLDSAAYIALGEAYAAAGETTLSQDCMISAKAAAQPTDLAAVAERAAAGDFEGLLEAARALPAAAAGDPRLRFLMAVALQSQNEVEAVVEQLEVACAAMPAFAEAHKGLGDYLALSARLAEMTGAARAAVLGGAAPSGDAARGRAEGAYRQALRHAPDWGEAHSYFANLLREMGRLGEALDHYRAAVADAPNDPIRRHNLARALEDLGSDAEAVAEAEAAIALKPDFGEAHECLARLRWRGGDAMAAAASYDAALGCPRFHSTELWP